MAPGQQSDKNLGLHDGISRRDFLNGTLIASGGALLSSVCPVQLLAQEDWTGFGGVGDYASANGNTFDVVTAGHKIRDGAYNDLPREIADTGEHYDCVIVGAGISGLAAAFFLHQRNPRATCLL